ncbi:PGPGW domain-containing protein [Nostocoides sp. F2B08]|uniref:PGPGW domain-containing protein n=1 Tax=Nostocoides sp. F2B08 TaxID=2653936 RepID=UPI001D03EC63|nr:PGPGW domain-containing protein [Tetrasphaera sp. F2B08]
MTEKPTRRPRRFRPSDPRYQPEHDFAWRAKIRANAQSYLIYRWIVFFVGLTIVCLGLVLVPLPGPGWFIVILGLLIWASEFERAQQLLDFVKDRLTVWNAWVMTQNWFVRGVLGLLTFAFVLLIVWAVLRLSGSVVLLPQPYEDWMQEHLWL